MKNIKKLIAIMLVLLLAVSFSVFAQAEDVRLAALKGPTAMGLVRLLDTAQGYDFMLAGSADEITPKLIQGQIDIAAIPVNLASVLYNKTNGALELVAVNALGVLYIVEKGGESVQSIASLKGQTVYATGKGSTPEYTLTYLLAQNGLEIGKDVQVEWRSEPTEVVALMASADHAVAMLPQPYVTVAGAKLENYRVALDLTAEWDRLENGSRLITAGIVVRKEFAAQYPEKVQAFVDAYAASAAYANENVAETAQLIEKYGIVNAAVAEKALPQCNIVCLTGESMREALKGYLETLYALNPASVGGTLPGEDFYALYEAQNTAE